MKNKELLLKISDSPPVTCPAKPSLEERPLLTSEQAIELAAVFKVLVNDTRLKLLHALAKAGEMRVADLSLALEMKTQAVSNQLQGLANMGILGSRRSGTNIFYRIIDPCIVRILEYGLCLIEDSRARKK